MQPLNPLLQGKGMSRPDDFSSEKQNVLNAELDHSLRYFVIFIFLGGGAATWLSYVIMLLHRAPDAVALINVGIVATLFLLVMVFQSVLIRSVQFNVFLALIEGALLPVFSYTNFSPWFAVATALFVIIWWFGYSHAQVMINAALKVNFWHYSSALITASISALAIFLACFYVGIYQLAGGFSFSAYRLVTTATGLEYAVPNFNPETRIDTFFEELVRSKAMTMSEFQKLPLSEQEATVKDAAKGIQDNVTSFTRLPAQPDENFLEYTYRVIIELLNSAQQKGYGAFVIGGLILSIFLSIKGVMFFVKWPVLFLAFILYILLQAIGVISIGAEMRQKEVIVVK